MTFDMRKQVVRSEKIKKALGLNQLNVEFVNIFGENWMKMDCLLDYDYDKKELKSSKLEDNVYIYNGDNCNINFDDISEENFMEIFRNYLFRLVVGANDHCCRNFITDGNIVYSIDDHCLDRDFEDMNIKMKKDNKTRWDSYIIIYKNDILRILNMWKHVFKCDSMLKRIDKLIEII